MLATLPRTVNAQSAAEHIAAGDAAYEDTKLEQALTHYEAAIAADPTAYPALWKASLVAVSLGEFHSDTAQRDSLYARAVRYARKAAAVNPADAEGHFCLARALGREALTRDLVSRAKYVGSIREAVLAALDANPEHAGALHVLGVWHQNLMELGLLERSVAKSMIGADVFNEATWKGAQRNLEAAVALAPNSIVHRLDLGRFYAVRGEEEKAAAQFKWILKAPSVDYNDDAYRRQAEAALRELE